MGDWSSEDLSKSIERRRGRPRRATGVVRDGPPPPTVTWSLGDWASQFALETGHKARVRGVTQVCVRDTDGATMWEGGVRELELSIEPWVGYAWLANEGERLRFRFALQSETVRSAEDAVRAHL